MKYEAEVEGSHFEIEVLRGVDGVKVTVDGKPIAVDCRNLRRPGAYSLLVDGMTHEVEVDGEGPKYSVSLGGRTVPCRVEDAKSVRLRELAGGADEDEGFLELRSPMPGLVLTVEVALGDRVEKGQGLVIVEAMKMENELRAADDGVVKEIRVKPQQTVDKDEILIVFESGA